MIQDLNADEQLMIPESSPEVMQIDPKRERFPLCIVWTSLPIISWFVPFIGHIGICREDGVILDFAGPNFVCVDNFAFGSVTRYLKIDKKLCSAITTSKNHGNTDQQNPSGYEQEILTWDDALRKSTQEFQHRSYNILTCNCHSFVANNLNRLGFRGGRWNVVTVAALLAFKGRWVDTKSMAKACLPFLIVFSLGVALGGWSFVQLWVVLLVVVVGWFVLGTYLFRGYIQL